MEKHETRHSGDSYIRWGTLPDYALSLYLRRGLTPAQQSRIVEAVEAALVDLGLTQV